MQAQYQIDIRIFYWGIWLSFTRFSLARTHHGSLWMLCRSLYTCILPTTSGLAHQWQIPNRIIQVMTSTTVVIPPP